MSGRGLGGGERRRLINHLGYSVGSLALVADSFHMLNDVMSLVVALYAVKVRFGAVYARVTQKTWTPALMK